MASFKTFFPFDREAFSQADWDLYPWRTDTQSRCNVGDIDRPNMPIEFEERRRRRDQAKLEPYASRRVLIVYPEDMSQDGHDCVIPADSLSANICFDYRSSVSVRREPSENPRLILMDTVIGVRKRGDRFDTSRKYHWVVTDPDNSDWVDVLDNPKYTSQKKFVVKDTAEPVLSPVGGDLYFMWTMKDTWVFTDPYDPGDGERWTIVAKGPDYFVNHLHILSRELYCNEIALLKKDAKPGSVIFNRRFDWDAEGDKIELAVFNRHTKEPELEVRNPHSEAWNDSTVSDFVDRVMGAGEEVSGSFVPYLEQDAAGSWFVHVPVEYYREEFGGFVFPATGLDEPICGLPTKLLTPRADQALKDEARRDADLEDHKRIMANR